MDKSQSFQRFQQDVVEHFSSRESQHIWSEINHCNYLLYGEKWNESRYSDMIQRLLNHEPYQYITGRAYFYDFELNVSPATLIPRSETEELVEWVLQEYGGSSPKRVGQALQVLDIGTGSGCIAIALASKLENAIVEAIDVSDKALELAAKNANELGVNVNFSHVDVLNSKAFRKTYDVIVSNPPYIPQKEKTIMHSNVLEHEPSLALFVENEDPLIFYRKIANLALNSLSEIGTLYFECNEFNAPELVKMLTKIYTNVTLRKDIQGKDRMISVKK